MESGSSRSGYHEPVPGSAGPEVFEDDWGDDFPKTFSVNLIWAQANDKEGRSGAIGYEGEMPWHLPEDLKRFKELTVSHPVIMGRKTWEALNNGSWKLMENSGWLTPKKPEGIDRYRYLTFERNTGDEQAEEE